ncbi:anti-sigma factor [Ramlibacter tataouinensis]|uniref:Anti-sigma K factor RskA C-terminal domain-containing protein n=1 Tax=Ramlibacter tataouinensis (strain ATCC BAA-407 / DSM 14655 / LMG 21543 / TTB310) TaxID=365046 RepID=F5Y0C6_RAMTT|nr:anti-sigma factor [Ramlibacter tataouinensis]AEG92148.1 conserved hypothetical protein [Ramlibacter tataouinensis TTB310]
MNLIDHPELLDRLAAAYALGTLRGGARRRFESLARQSVTVRAAALLWQERFASMTELQHVEAPSPNVWKRIENLVAAQARGTASVLQETAMLDKLRRGLGWWRGAALAGVAATVVAVAVGLNLGRQVQVQDAQLAQAGGRAEQLVRENAQLRATPHIQYVAVLADDKASASILVTFDPRHNALTLKHVAPIQVGADKSLELWALPPSGGPRSLGVLDGGAVVRLPAAENQVREVPALAVSLEPRGGVPPGSGPTGPILFKGPLLQTPQV